ncbi:hypothetical protein [Streptomyces sporangiiformans]|nr:hypothetical protein [Streptomyces sporangiiformans]
MVWENTEDSTAAPGELREVSRAETLRLFALLADGDIAAVDGVPWRV